MHFYKNFFKDFVKPSRLISEGLDAAEKGLVSAECLDDEITKEKAIQLAQEQEKKLQETLGEGEPEKYLETFRKFEKTTGFHALTAQLDELIKVNDFFNFENWPYLEDQDQLVQFWEKGIVADVLPGGPGSRQFLEGLKLYEDVNKLDATDKSADADDKRTRHGKSMDVLHSIVTELKTHFQSKHESETNLKELKDKPALGTGVTDCAKTLMKNFQRGSGTEKLLILGALGIAIKLIWDNKDLKIFGDKGPKISSILMWIGTGLGINYLSGKASKTGRTFLQRLDVTRTIDDLQDKNKVKAFAYESGMESDEEKINTFLQVMHIDVRRLYELYREESVFDRSPKAIDPAALGFYKNEVDGKALYEIMDKLVKVTAVNEKLRLQQEETEKAHLTYVDPTAEARMEMINSIDSGFAKAAFEEKYFTGELGKRKQTLFDAIANEYDSRTVDAVVNAGEKKRKVVRAKEWTAKKLDYAYEKGKEYGIAAGAYIYEKGGKAWDWSKKSIFDPIGEFSKDRWNEYKLYGFKDLFLRNKLALEQEKDLQNVLPPDLDVRVTHPNEAVIMGYPGIRFEVREREGDHKPVIIVDGKFEFPIHEGVKGNSKKATELEQYISAEVNKFAQANTREISDRLTKPTPEWKDKKWWFREVKVNQDGLLFGGGKNKQAKDDFSFTITFNDDGEKQFHLFSKDKEIKDMDEADEIYRDSAIEQAVREAIYKSNPQLKKYFEHLPVTFDWVKKDDEEEPVFQCFQCKVGGLTVLAAPSTRGGSIEQGIVFRVDPTTAQTLDFDNIIIKEDNEGKVFLQTLAENILKEDDYFLDPFLTLEAKMANTTEGLGVRWENLNAQRIWILPVGIKGAINGDILDNQWKFTLQFKMFEALDMFRGQLKDKKISEIPNAYKKYIEYTHNELTKLSQRISGLSDKQRALQFQTLLSGSDGLEHVNYRNAAYRKLCGDYKKMITNPRFNYEGLDKLDVLGDIPYEIYNLLLRVWSFHTRQYAMGEPGAAFNKLTPATEQSLNSIISTIENKLEKAMKEGNGTIHREDLPAGGRDDEKSLDEWKNP